MIENTILLMIGLTFICLVFVVGEVLAKKFGWE
jgi:hypothetical protein